MRARYHDGLVAETLEVEFALDPASSPPMLVIRDEAAVLDRWAADAVYEVPARDNELRMGVADRPYGARLVVAGRAEGKAVRQMLPALARGQRRERGRQARLLGMATAALVSVIVAYVVGVPLLANRIAAVVPPDWEAQLGETARGQIEKLIAEEGGFQVCDSNPDSLANRAIARFAAATVDGSGTPFTPAIQVVRSSIANAFALPGGHSYYFSALLEQTETADEFAGVMAHELGHVVRRHGMEQLIATSATGLLIGFILGDMTGLSVAGGIGAALIDTRFSREAEREADRFAAEAGLRLGFQPAALATLLERIAGDDEMSGTFELLSSHPLTAERRVALESYRLPEAAAPAVFSAEEWRAIKSMCGRPADVN